MDFQKLFDRGRTTSFDRILLNPRSLDELVDSITVLACEADELPRLHDDRAVVGGGRRP
jgi:hypothetical protein